MKDTLTYAVQKAYARGPNYLTHEEAEELVEAIRRGRFDHLDLLALTESLQDASVQAWRNIILHDAGILED